MDDREFGNKVCDALYAWVKGDGPEPYAPRVASLVTLVLKLLEEDRARRNTNP
jgi:hypothetical protein